MQGGLVMNGTYSLTNELRLEWLTWREQDILSLLAERYTNREIAQNLGLELTTVKWYNQQIYDKLGVKNRRAAVAQAEDLGLLEDAQSDMTASVLAAPEHNLPAQVTSFIGRERDIAAVERLLQSARLVTLTGPGGMGGRPHHRGGAWPPATCHPNRHRNLAGFPADPATAAGA
jgi:DNA-binding CsgD family transcriptional regulator